MFELGLVIILIKTLKVFLDNDKLNDGDAVYFAGGAYGCDGNIMGVIIISNLIDKIIINISYVSSNV